MEKKIIAYIELFFAMAIVGSTIVVSKIIADTFPPFFGATLTLIAALVGILPFYLFETKKRKIRPTFNDWKHLAMQSITGVVLFRVCSFYGLKLTSPVDAGIITATTPAVIALIALGFLREKVSNNMWIAIVLSITGLLIINLSTELDSSESDAGNQIIGNVIIMLAVICEALFTIFRKKTHKISAIQGTFHIIWIGLVLSIPLAFVDLNYSELLDYKFSDFLPILYYAIFGSVIAFILWFDGVDKVSASIAGLFTGVMPVSAVILSFLFLGEVIEWFHITGISLVLLGIYFGSRKKPMDNERPVHNRTRCNK